ncbi:hypothetical protein HBI56_022440 [Parastagonospora nodorum]|uniref:Uncharacterized protein n=1 Tax=Phaeosphaeria nodorum (strain SN15 / ATCC MYA-4574 / FGSC 10173) TaxID=321614 RepID=A0A7U2I3X5_PHANO|nr:hypothetical protein HBH56_026080 [Parastagonospora nodorum]QRC98926.1 hypothetical protein JI435_062840 [Parastagonospora nodorum SN15]KAH3934568.1 hypothetical protein HBH54_055930 [Parastagonospora nodorum]KAH3949669.1 hypothetical protein HBH53_083630 [Parastagonospora nodorum]KAH3975808.1 hypothetical protein HBH51_081730 [Parastagonospora nodorum]
MFAQREGTRCVEVRSQERSGHELREGVPDTYRPAIEPQRRRPRVGGGTMIKRSASSPAATSCQPLGLSASGR